MIKTCRIASAQQPFFSVLIPSYARPNYLRECIKSVYECEFKDFELIISDDMSPNIDEIMEVITPYLHRSNFTFIRQPANLGMARNWIELVNNATGKYVLIMGDDDKLLPHTLTKLNEYIHKYPDYDLYGFGYNVIDENDEFCYCRKAPSAFEITNCSSFVNSVFYSDIIPFWVFHPFTICYDRRISYEVKYDAGAFIGSDLLFLFDCLNKGKKMFVIPEALFLWRKVQGRGDCQYRNLSSLSLSSIIARKNILHILEQRNDLQPSISRLVLNYSFRKRFLYDQIARDKSFSKTDMDNLNLKKDYLEELRELYNSGGYFYHRLRIKLYQVFDYVRLFGFKSIFQLILFAYYKLMYKIKKTKFRTLL